MHGWLPHTPVHFVQTAESMPLPAFRWPKRAVLVLGHEHTGIPMSILRVQASLTCLAACPVWLVSAQTH